MILYIQYSWWVTSLVYHITAVTLLICSYWCAVQNEMLRCTADSHIWTSYCSKGSNSPHRHGVMTCCMPLIAFGRLEDWMCLYFKGCWAQVSPKVLLPHSRWGILTPHLIDMWFLVLVWVCPGMAFQLVKPAFCNAGGCDQHTDRQTDRQYLALLVAICKHYHVHSLLLHCRDASKSCWTHAVQ